MEANLARINFVTVRLNKREIEALVMLSRKKGMSRTEYIRYIIEREMIKLELNNGATL